MSEQSDHLNLSSAYQGVNSEEKKKKHLIFRLGEERYGIPLALIKEVIGVAMITPIPRAPDFYKGMINLRGQIISVIDLRLKLKLPETPIVAKKSSIIISRVGDVVVGAIVDEVIEVTAYVDSQIDNTEAERINRSGDGVYGVAKDRDNLLTLLIDLERALDKTEFKVLLDQAS